MSLNQGNLPQGLQMQPVGNTWRSFGADLFDKENIERENWLRSEQQSNNQYLRDLSLQTIANEFSANESQKSRDFEERMSNSAYQRAVADMKKAGINPVMLYGNLSGASTPAVPSVSSSGARSDGSRYSSRNTESGQVLSGILNFLGNFLGGLVRKPTQVTNNYNGVKRQTNK